MIRKRATHKIPTDLQKAISSASTARAAWENITSLARNEWICWTITAKKRKRGVAESKEHVRNLWRENADLVVGPVALIVKISEIRTRFRLEKIYKKIYKN